VPLAFNQPCLFQLGGGPVPSAKPPRKRINRLGGQRHPVIATTTIGSRIDSGQGDQGTARLSENFEFWWLWWLWWLFLTSRENDSVKLIFVLCSRSHV
jgi:hypothetical protein